MKKVAFLDRDGALIYEPEETKQIDSLEKLKILDGVIPGLKSLLKQGYELVMVSNQDGIGTKSFPKKDFEIPQNKLIELLKQKKITFSQVFVCPHKPEDNCECRKPKIGMVKKYLDNNEIDYENSILIGDRESDKQFANNIGVRFIKMQTNTTFPRFAQVKRKTKETDIAINVNLDGTGKYNIKTGIGFLDHMLELFSKHSLIDLDIKVNGDLAVDEHHTIEDVGIVLGETIKKALGNKKGIKRYGFLLPMDESLAQVALDLSGRSYLIFNYKANREFVGELPTELLEDFWLGFSSSLGCNLNIKVTGRNEHHKIEAMFKAVAKSLKMAVENDPRVKNMLPSTKGKL